MQIHVHMLLVYPKIDRIKPYIVKIQEGGRVSRPFWCGFFFSTIRVGGNKSNHTWSASLHKLSVCFGIKEAYWYFCIKHIFISYQNFAIFFKTNVIGISFKICVSSKHKRRNNILLADVLRRTEHLKKG